MTFDFDVIVIGGGIHGAGVAQAASAGGYSVMLLEQNEIASGTSSKSSKLIHGGLRYLETAQFSLVRECLQERALLLKNAPHLVKLKPFFIPLYEYSQRTSFEIRIGLSLYRLLGGMSRQCRFKSIKPKDWQRLDGLETKHLKHIFQYWDAQTDDALLTRAVIQSAQSMGLQLKTHSQVDVVIKNNEGWLVRYNNKDQTHEATSTVIVNAAGPWVNNVLSKINGKPVSHKSVDLVQGTHIVLPGEISEGIYYLESLIDQRAIFVMPWYGNTLVGTTEKPYAGNPESVTATEEEITYLLNSVTSYFPKFKKYKRNDIINVFAGLRVLPLAKGLAFSRPRETTIYEDKENAKGLFSIYGGKLTAYRATSERVIKTIQHLLPDKKAVADTRNLKLPE